MKQCGNCMAESGMCTKCKARYPQGSAATCAVAACSAAPVECQCGLLVAGDLAGVIDMDGNPIPWQ